jgi:hypothetical protein
MTTSNLTTMKRKAVEMEMAEEQKAKKAKTTIETDSDEELFPMITVSNPLTLPPREKTVLLYTVQNCRKTATAAKKAKIDLERELVKNKGELARLTRVRDRLRLLKAYRRDIETVEAEMDKVFDDIEKNELKRKEFEELWLKLYLKEKKKKKPGKK